MSLVEKYFPRELYDVLKALEREGEATTMQISELAGVSHSFLLGVLPSLKDKGFVSVLRGQTDKRQKLVRLTDGGRFLLHALEVYRATLDGNFALIKSITQALKREGS